MWSISISLHLSLGEICVSLCFDVTMGSYLTKKSLLCFHRPNASQLLTHAFLRQTHKKTVRGIFSFLQSRVLAVEDEDQVASDERYQKTTRQNSSSTGVQDKVWSFE